MQTMIGFIGGSGFENFLDTKSIEIINVTNEWGKPSQAIKRISLGNKEFLFLQRHGDGKILPHKINYQANIKALYDLGVRKILASAAVGGITIKTGKIVIPDQLIDYTYNRPQTFFEHSDTVKHVEFSQPYNHKLRSQLAKACKDLEVKFINEKKVKDIFLAYRLEETYSKEEIFEFYVNRIFFGNRAYGIAAASEVYYGRPLSELNLAQWAMIAALPKAPSSMNPLVNPKRALVRRNWILERMLELGFIHSEQFRLAIDAPLTANYYGLVSEVEAPYVAEEVRRYMIQEYGLKAYSEGLEVFTTINSKFQNQASRSVSLGLEDYDKRHGFREPENIFEVFPEGFFDQPKNVKQTNIENSLKRDDEDLLVTESTLLDVLDYLHKFTENKNIK